MIRPSTLSLLASVLLVAPLAAGARQPEDDSWSSTVDRLAAELMEADRIPGLAVALGCREEDHWTAVYGEADRAAGTPITDDTRFRTGSVSKALTSALLGRLLEEERLGLEDPVRNWVPEWAELDRAVTVRHLAAHLSGIAHYQGADFVNRTHYPTLLDALDKYRDRAPVAKPGERFYYSSYAWNLLGLVLERAAGTPFLEAMKREVFVPLELVDTLPEWPDREIERRATAYGVLGNKVIRGPKIDNSDAWPSAGFLASAQDLVAFGQAILANRLFSKETRGDLWQVQRTDDGTLTGWGLGWQWTDLGDLRAVGHGGSHVGATAQLYLVPAEDLVVSALANANSPGLDALAADLVRLAVERDWCSRGVQQPAG